MRKIKGAGPGMVTYRNERTIRVQPSPEERLRHFCQTLSQSWSADLFRVRRHQHPIDPAAIHVDHLEAMSAPIGLVADVRYPLQARHQESTQRLIVAVLLTW